MLQYRALSLTSLQLAEAVRDAYQVNLRPVQHDETELVSITVLSVVPVTLNVGNVGTLNGQGAPPNCTYMVVKNPVAGRAGRWFLPGLQDDDTFADGTISSTRATAVTNACNAFLADATADGAELEIAREGGLNDAVASLTCQTLIGVQRRRLRR